MSITRYKLSRYNVIVNSNEQPYLWNTYSGAGIKLNNGGLQYIKDFNGEDNSSEYFRILQSNGCIISKETNELKRVLIEEKSQLFNKYNRKVSFTIAPGLGCNYRCIYCFEGEHHTNQKMSFKTIEDTCEFISSVIDNNPIAESCYILWFGGEPLLYLNEIQLISEKLIKYCLKKNISFQASMITNGRYLEFKVLDLLEQIGIQNIQISLDGMEKQYRERKKAQLEDFQIVISNIKAASRKFKIVIRLNIESDNLDEANRLTEFLLIDNELDGKIKIYLAYIRNYNLSLEEEVQRNRSYNIAKNRYIDDFLNKYSIHSLGYSPPMRLKTSCTQVCESNFCIGPKGELYKCEHYFGNDEAVIGSIYDGQTYTNSFCDYYLASHENKCIECSFLPVCLGGCIDDRIRDKQIIECDSHINNLLKMKTLDLTLREKSIIRSSK